MQFGDIVSYCRDYHVAATASTLNSVLMRHHELREGIEVVDDQGKVVGTSVIAARKVMQLVCVCTA